MTSLDDAIDRIVAEGKTPETMKAVHHDGKLTKEALAEFDDLHNGRFEREVSTVEWEASPGNIVEDIRRANKICEEECIDIGAWRNVAFPVPNGQ